MNTTNKWYDGALLINRDPNWYGAIDVTSAETARESMKDYFSRFKGHAVTDVMLGVLEQTTMIPNKSFYWRGDKYLQKIENGFEVDYTKNGVANLYKCFAEYNVDAVQIFIDTMREIGIRPWLALRMNDAHFGVEKTSFLHSDMFYEADKAGEMIGAEYGYFAHCYNFRYPRYRTAILGYIEEILNKYDVFGLELDFMREIHCFDYKHDPDCAKIMTEYIREIRKITEAVGKRVGHDIKVLIRTCRDPKDALTFGFDIKGMCDEGLLDAVVPTPRWSCTDSAVPVNVWRELLGDDIAVFGGIETLNLKSTTNMPVNSKAYAAAFFAGGADGIYFNNHEYDTERNRSAWMITRESCLEGRREFVVTWQDTAAAGNPQYKPLPMKVDSCGKIELNIGKVTESASVQVVIDWEGDAIPTLDAGCMKNVTGSVISPVTAKKGADTVSFTEHTPLSFDISGISTDNALTLNFNGNGTVNYINIIIEA